MNCKLLYTLLLVVLCCAIGTQAKAQDFGTEDAQEGDMMTVLNPDGSTSTYVYSDYCGCWNWNSTAQPPNQTTPPAPPAGSTPLTPNADGSYTFTFDNGASITTNTDGTYDVSTSQGTCTGCTLAQAEADIPVTMPPPIPPAAGATQAQQNAYNAAVALYDAAMANYAAAPPPPPATQTKDCAGVVGGTATVDACGICTGGTTGYPPCTLTKSFQSLVNAGNFMSAVNLIISTYHFTSPNATIVITNSPKLIITTSQILKTGAVETISVPSPLLQAISTHILLFGMLVRSLGHEYQHVAQMTGNPPMALHEQREFLAYVWSLITDTLPVEDTSNHDLWVTKLTQYYNALPPALQTQYKAMYQNALTH
jgi:hypothetical protein